MNEIKIEVPNGLYVIAVSGGVDSMSLLHILKNKPNVKLVVAHFDHGIRETSVLDRRLVETVTRSYKLPFVYDRVNLGIGTSEEQARKHRYDFLKTVLRASQANAIITAHHQDDLIETAVFNLLRGTNRKGLSSLKSTDILVRPMLHVSKKQIYDYARANGLIWSEDTTNQDLIYKRNYIRHKILPRLSSKDKHNLNEIIKSASLTNDQLDNELNDFIQQNSIDGNLERHSFIMLPHGVAVEVMASWLRLKGIRDFNSKLLSNLVIASKTFRNGQQTDINSEYILQVDQRNLALKAREC